MAYNYQGGPMAMGMAQAGQSPNYMHGMMGGGHMMPGHMMPGHMMHGYPMIPDQQPILPGLNDAPLEFNTNKNKPPIPVPGGGDVDERGRGTASQTGGGSKEGGDKEPQQQPQQRGERGGGGAGRRGEREGRGRGDRNKERNKDREMEKAAPPLPMGEPPLPMEPPLPNEPPANGSMDLGPPAIGPWGSIMPPPMPYQMMGMPMMDPSMMMPQYGMLPPGGPIDGGVGQDLIQLKSVSLVPPPPGTPIPTTRERPPGCKTVFVGGLAENTTEEIIREIFSRCGEMLTVRLSNKKFCHIRFCHEASVDAALCFSGYRMRIENKTDAPNTGRLHVDFAQARDDQYEWECKQRQLQREQRHRDRVEKERLRVPSPPPVPHYTEHEATAVSEKIKGEESFGKAVQVVVTWLERGDCNKRNASVFYSIIQSTNSHIRRLLSEKASHEEELTRAKELMKARMQGLLLQYAQVERVFSAASHKKVWDHFTKAQRKNIEMWKKQAAEIKAVELEEHLGLEEMDVSDEEESPRKKFKMEDKQIAKIKDENDSLRCQLEAYKNEVDLVKSELKSELDKTEAQLKVARQTIQTMQKQLSEARRKQSSEQAKVLRLEGELASRAPADQAPGPTQTGSPPDPAPAPPFQEEDARLVGLISMFLHVHPFGAGVDYVWSYLHKVDPDIKPSQVESLLQRFPSLFEQELSGIGANMERRWVVTAFRTRDQ